MLIFGQSPYLPTTKINLFVAKYELKVCITNIILIGGQEYIIYITVKMYLSHIYTFHVLWVLRTPLTWLNKLSL